MRDLQDRLGLSYLFISHNLAVVRHMATRIGVMYLGRIVELAPAAELFAAPRHPYTRLLMDALPDLGMTGRPRTADRGRDPQPDRAAAGLRLPSALPLGVRALPRSRCRSWWSARGARRPVTPSRRGGSEVSSSADKADGCCWPYGLVRLSDNDCASAVFVVCWQDHWERKRPNEGQHAGLHRAPPAGADPDAVLRQPHRVRDGAPHSGQRHRPDAVARTTSAPTR